MKTSDLIQEFLAQRRVAFVGVSRKETDFSRHLFREFVNRGYDVVPVHPHASEIEQRPAVPRVQDIKPPVRAALVMTPRELSERIVLDCADAGIDLVWLYGVSGKEDVHPSALEAGRKHGVGIIAGYCPYMFFSKVPFYHTIHRYVWKMIGRYPQ